LPIILFQIAQYLSHVVVFLAADGEALDSVVVVVLDDLVGFGSVAEVVLVEDDQLLLLVPLDDQVELGVSAAVGDPGVADLHEDVDFVRVLLDQS
jgi:hypothetical protein